jgi:putative oxidoreductase
MADPSKLDWRLDFLETWSAPIVFIARLGLAAIFVIDGWQAMTNYAGVAAYMRSNGVSPLLLPLVILTEFGGGLMIVAGFRARPAAIALAGFCVLTALLFHAGGGGIDQIIHFEKDLAIAGGFLALAAFGPGAWSIDAWRAGQSR